MNEINLLEYEVIDYIGCGRFGEISIIREKNTQEIYAAKVIFRNVQLESEDDQLLIYREINKMITLNHPTILKFIGFSKTNFCNEPKPIVIMEYASNKSLFYFLGRMHSSPSKFWNSTKKLKCIYGIASGMKYLHSLEIIHRNLHPSNILLTNDFLPKISDFVLSNQTHNDSIKHSFESANEFLSWASFLAPEIWTKRIYSKASDVYAFGMIVYELMTTEIPFSNLNCDQIRDCVLNHQRPQFRIPLEDAYQQLITQCWSQNPKERPTFESIVQYLTQNSEFITDNVDQNEYFEYVKYLDEYSKAIDKSKEIQLRSLFAELLSERIINEMKVLANQGDSYAMNYYGNMFSAGEGVSMNKEEACQYYKMAADKGHVKAMNNYGRMLSKGSGIIMNKEAASRYFKMAADKGHVIAMLNYAYMLSHGDGISMNKEEANRYYKMAADKGHIE